MHMASGIFVTVAAADQKDNLIFGVQALGREGHPSLASYPLPKR